MLKAFLSSFSRVNLGHLLFFIIPSILGSVLNMMLMNVKPIDISSNVGSYVAVVITFGMLIRCYVAGFSGEGRDYREEDSDKSIYIMIGNIFIIVGFMLFIGNWVELAILLPIAIYHLIRGITSADGNFLFGEKGRWMASKCWRKELWVIAFISVLTIIVQIVGFKNGAPIPVVALR